MKKKKPLGLKNRQIQIDLDLYRVELPIRGVVDAHLSVIDLQPESVEETLFFLHGYAGCAETWEYQINHFASEYRVIAPDLRGHGKSDAPYTQYTMAELVEDIQTIVEELHLPEKFILAGHSFGGAICVEYANKYPQRLSKLVLIATAGEFPLPRAADLLTRIPTAFYRLWWDYRPKWNAEIHVMKRLMANNMRIWKGWNLLRNITTPTLVITGERDTYFPRYVFDDVGKMIPGAEIYDVGSAKHKVQLERHQAVNRAVERFVSNERSSWREQNEHNKLMQRRPWLSSYSKGTPVTIPLPRQPLHRFLESAAENMPKRTATVFYGSTLTYHQLNQMANQFAHALLGLGVRPGDRVMIVMPNVPQMIIAYYATLKIGGVVVLPNTDADMPTIVNEITQTQARVLVTLKAFSPMAQQVESLPSVQAIVLADIQDAVTPGVYKTLLSRWHRGSDSELDRHFPVKKAHMMHNLLTDSGIAPPAVTVNLSNLAAIVFTSGTTDKPKGACLTHANLTANALQTRHWIPDLKYGEEVFLSALPFVHSYGMTGAMNVPIAMAATIVLLPVFELQQVLEHIKKYVPTLFPGVPSMYTAINHAPNVRAYGLSSIKACLSGASPLPVEVQEEFEKLTRGRLVEGYGLTEASPVTHANPLYGVRKVGSIGVPIPNTDAKIIDLVTGENLPVGKIGELVVKGPQVMQGYWGQIDEKEAESVLKDGWLYTGDVAVMDSDRYFQIISRKRDTILAGEYSVYPRDVEEVLYENSKVLEAAVVGIPTTEKGQKIKAFVVPRHGTTLSKEELLALCHRRLEPYAVPWEIEFREELPKSFIGKVLRRMLVEEKQDKEG